jgi:hypothetical protein
VFNALLDVWDSIKVSKKEIELNNCYTKEDFIRYALEEVIEQETEE